MNTIGNIAKNISIIEWISFMQEFSYKTCIFPITTYPRWSQLSMLLSTFSCVSFPVWLDVQMHKMAWKESIHFAVPHSCHSHVSILRWSSNCASGIVRLLDHWGFLPIICHSFELQKAHLKSGDEHLNTTKVDKQLCLLICFLIFDCSDMCQNI